VDAYAERPALFREARRPWTGGRKDQGCGSCLVAWREAVDAGDGCCTPREILAAVERGELAA
jgi:hypothetical protein